MPIRQARTWALYDFASSAFTTLVVTFIYSAFFTRAIASDPDRGAIQWSVAVNISALALAVLVPLLGAIADGTGRRRIFLAVATLLAVVPTALLFFPLRGDVVIALALFVVANLGYEASYVFYNAFLPDVAPPGQLGRISGYGQGLGYAGGLLCLIGALAILRVWNAPDDLPVRATMLLTAVWYALFAIPFLVRAKEVAREPVSVTQSVRNGVRRLRTTLGHLRDEHRQAARLIVARMIYNDGLTTVFAFAAIYASATFAMTTEDLIVMGILLNVVSAAGSFTFGPLTDRIGPRRTIMITLVGLIIATLLGAAAPNRAVFWASAVLLGWMIGPNQAASRSFLAQLTPPDRRAEFFGFFAFSGRLAALLGPALFGLTLSITGNQRFAIGSSVIFFVAGALLLLRVSESESPSPRSGATVAADLS